MPSGLIPIPAPEGSDFYDDIQQLAVTPFIKQELIGVDLFVWDVNNVIELNKKGSPFLQLIQREGRVLYMSEDHLKEWFKFAKDDYEMAGVLLANGYYRGSCIHSQQAIGKCLKAMLIKKGWDLEKIHSIERLIALAEDFGIKLIIEEDDIIFIDSIYRGRSPGEEGILPLSEPGEKEAKRAVVIAKNILMEVNKLL